MFSWLRKTLSISTSTSNGTKFEETQKKGISKIEEQEQGYYGVTNPLIEFIKSFTIDIFKNFSHLDEEDGGIETTSGGVRVDLSEWQQRHATIVLSKSKDLSQLRYMLCPRHLKEREFWRIYFTLVKSYVTEYELRAIRLDKLRRMAMDNEKASDTTEIELEMTETKKTSDLAPP